MLTLICLYTGEGILHAVTCIHMNTHTYLQQHTSVLTVILKANSRTVH